MATSSSLSNFLSSLLPKTPPPPKASPPPPPPQLNLSPSSTRFPSQTHKFTHNLVPLVAKDDHFSSSSSTTTNTTSPNAPCLSADLSAVICPSLAYANTLFFKSAYNVQVVVDDNEPEERLLNRFRREVMKAGVIQECKRRRFFENKQDEKKRKTREAAKRRSRMRRPQLKSPIQNKRDIPTTTKKEEDDDNWDLPEGDTPS